MARGCAGLTPELDTAKICSDGRVDVDRARLRAVFGGEKRFHTAWVKSGSHLRFAERSAFPRIVLQNSKVAAVKIFGENLKRKEVDDSHSFVALPKSPMNLAQGDEVPRIITRRTRQRPSEFLTLPANDFCNTIPLLADIPRADIFVFRAFCKLSMGRGARSGLGAQPPH